MPESYRALGQCCVVVLKGYRGDMPGLATGDHAADSHIAGAGACVPSQAMDWYDPPGFMTSPALEPSNFLLVADGIARELACLRGVAFEVRVPSSMTTSNRTEPRSCGSCRARLAMPG
jgi:hypothetical protein